MVITSIHRRPHNCLNGPRQESKPNFRMQNTRKYLFGLTTFRTWRIVALVSTDKEVAEKKTRENILSLCTVNSQ